MSNYLKFEVGKIYPTVGGDRVKVIAENKDGYGGVGTIVCADNYWRFNDPTNTFHGCLTGSTDREDPRTLLHEKEPRINPQLSLF